MVAECDFVAAEVFGLAVEVAAAHARTEIAGVFVGIVRDIKDVGLENSNRDVEQFCVALDFCAVNFVVARIHDEVDDLKGNVAVAVQFLEKLGKQHGVFAAGNTDRDFIARLYEFIALYGGNKGIPELLSVFFDNAPFGELIGQEFSCHGHSFQKALCMQERSERT